MHIFLSFSVRALLYIFPGFGHGLNLSLNPINNIGKLGRAVISVDCKQANLIVHGF